ncbi:hypothetical protein FG93_05463 [Bosea sp. LC85]|uniref:hypothetical protein n=1 Tax=Bosea sp. LC85 TaxID=1502851 RepID=UPI0004E42F3C|nr:hypothetical protein [Bosea sp. LC85]KFC63953.1 hypothetical protein FG93_05463 [Bosea sp. LC85]
MPIRPTIPPTLDTDLRHYPWIVIRFRCNYCKRWADGGLAACAEKFGAAMTLGDLLEMFRGRCAWRAEIRKPQKYGFKCGGYCLDIGKTRPPDLPATMSGLTVIEGGRDDLLPAEPREIERRKRIGEE